MSSIINADTSDGVKITSDTSGELKLQSAGTDIATVSSTGIAMGSGKIISSNNLGFHAYLSSVQSITTATWTKVQFDTERFDTSSCFDNVTNYRFTPTVAGYYHVGTAGRLYATSKYVSALTIYKNGAAAGGFQTNANGTLPNYTAQHIAGLVYMNGSTDYLEVYGYIGGTTPSFQAGQNTTYFYGYLVQAD